VTNYTKLFLSEYCLGFDLGCAASGIHYAKRVLWNWHLGPML